MSMIAMCCHDTETNGRTEYTRQTLESLMYTVDWLRHRLVLIDNNSCKQTKDLLKEYINPTTTVITLSENVGTARGINYAIRMREPGEMACKMDNDVVVHYEDGWLEQMEYVFEQDKGIGIVGLRRDDIWQSPTHANPAYRTVIEKCGKLNIEICDDIIGTCTGLRPELLDKVGFYSQVGVYGFDDQIINCRSIAAGFRNCFLPDIKITHLDDGKNRYSDWKREESGKHLVEACAYMDLIKNGELSYYYDGE